MLRSFQCGLLLVICFYAYNLSYRNLRYGSQQSTTTLEVTGIPNVVAVPVELQLDLGCPRPCPGVWDIVAVCVEEGFIALEFGSTGPVPWLAGDCAFLQDRGIDVIGPC
jgi:hypothetical protein